MKTVTTTTKATNILRAYLSMLILTLFSIRNNKTRCLKFIRMICLLLFAGIFINASATVYVTPSGAGNHDGTSWANAKTFPEAAAPFINDEIWMKAGTYDGTGSLALSIELALYGGFNGTETTRDQRNPKLNMTVLQNFTIYENSNVAMVFDGFNCLNTALIHLSGATVNNCNFSNSEIQTNSDFSQPNTFTDCTFRNHSAPSAAVTIFVGSSTFTRCTFSNNTNTSASSGGGGAVVVNSDLATTAGQNASGRFYECVFDHNTCTGPGGALSLANTGTSLVVNCLFKDNSAQGVGGAIFSVENAAGTHSFFLNTFTGNSSPNGSVIGLYSSGTANFFANNIVWGNTGSASWLFTRNFALQYPKPNFAYNVIQDDISSNSDISAANNIIKDPLFNTDYSLSGCSPAINAGRASISMNGITEDATAGRTKDLAGNPRIHSTNPDMGCYEFQGSDPVLTTWYADSDHDGFGNPSVSQSSCNQPPGYVSNNTDCNDNDASKWRSASLYIDNDNDGYDNGTATVCYGTTIPTGYKSSTLGPDCDDNNLAKWRSGQLYVDADGDGYTVGAVTPVCYGANIPTGYVATSLGTDCNDNDNTKWQTASLYVDADGDGYTVGSPTPVCFGNFYPPGYRPTSAGTDCNDIDNTKWRTGQFFVDADGDGYTVGSATSVCYGATVPTGYTATSLGTDCNDSNPGIHGAQTWYLDADNDGHYVSSQLSCTSPGAGYNTTATQSGDCDDNNNTKWQSAQLYVDADGDGYTVGARTSVCYGATIPAGYSATSLGNDCNDNDNTKWQSTLLYVDADGDGYTVGSLTSVCYGATIPAGYVATSLGNDCDDNNAAAHVVQTWYLDADNDGHYLSFQQSCGSPGTGYNTTATQAGDCNDNDNTKWRTGQFFVDADRDGYTVGSATSVCYGATTPTGYAATSLGTDCNDNDNTKWNSLLMYVDADGDGYAGGPLTSVCYGATIPAGYKLSSLGSDCNDNDPNVHGATTWYLDADNDGHYVSSQSACASPGAGYNTTATQNGDCDDNDATKWRSTQLYIDADGDEYAGGPLTTVCYGATIPAGYIAISLGNDCNDNDATKWRSGSLYIDNDDDGYDNGTATVCYGTFVPSGYKAFTLGPDCDDNDATKRQTAQVYVDADGDGYTVGSLISVCYGSTIPAGYVTSSLGPDCNDADATINPLTKWYIDADGDGYGTGIFATQCTRAVNGYLASELTATSGDCNDADPAINPATRWYLDADNDGYYTGGYIIACTSPGAGYRYTGVQPGDCYDSDPSVHPGATEICGNGIDDNCNGVIDEECPTYTYYRDADGDSYGGDETMTTTLSTPPGGWAAVSGDCNDYDPSVNPGATEICGNGVDDNCNGQIDECTTYYPDADGDGYGRSNAPMSILNGSIPPAGYVLLNGDCNDGNTSVHPGATEICGNGIDDNCNGQVDECTIYTYYLDNDGDGYGLIYITTQSFETTPPQGYAALAGDCDDSDPSVHPGAPEICNGIDDNCNGVIDEGCITYYLDGDGDGYGKDDVTINSTETTPPAGYAASGGDCNDDDGSVHPGATEICGNGIDDNCDGQVDEDCPVYTYYFDSDRDGYGGDVWGSSTNPNPPDGYSLIGGDCVDYDGSIHPGATETCNGIDDNCDGVIDEGCTRGQLPDFTKPDINGVSHHLYGDLAAGKAVVMEFSTGWCPFTNIAEPQISKVYDDVCQGQGNIKLYDIVFENETQGFPSDDAFGTVYANHHNAVYPVIANSQDVYSDFWYQYSITGIPTFFVVIPDASDPAKSTVYKIEGALENLKDSIEHILASNGYGIMPPPSLSITVTGNVCDLPSPVTLTSNQSAGIVWSTGQTTQSITITAPGVYSVSYTAGCGTITKKVYIAGKLTATTLVSSSNTACAGGNGIFGLTYDGEHPDAVLQYSLDGTNWNTYVEGFGGERLFFNQWAAGTTISFRVKEPVTNSMGLPDCEAYSNVVQIVSQQLPEAFEITADNNDCSFPKTLTSPYSDNFWSTQETTQSITINSPGYYAVYSNAACGQVYDDILVNSQVITWYRDADGDYYGNGAITTTACTQPSGYSPYDGDCDDNDAGVYPGAPEICGNGKDDNCDGQVDEGCSAYTYYVDNDGDGHGETNSSTASSSPTPPPGYAAVGGDCDDNDNAKWQSALLYVDADGDGYTVGSAISVCYGSTIPTGYSLTSLGNDCNDNDNAKWQSALLYVDADGDGYTVGSATSVCYGAAIPNGYKATSLGTDCNDANAAIHGAQTWYLDADNDGHYINSQVSCTKPGAGYNTTATQSGDCNDNDATKWQSALLYVDADGDGYTVGAATSVCCGATIPAGYKVTSLGTDCNDKNAAVHGAQTWYKDADNDGHYVSSQVSCTSPGKGYNTTATQSGDCNDNDATKWQSALLYVDADGDGYTVGAATSVCYGATIPAGYKATSLGTDCNDKNAAVNPGATEICDGIDNNCNGTIDEGCATATLSINDTSMVEGNKGKTGMTFTITLSAASTKKVTVPFATSNGTATAGSDYDGKTGTITFNPGTTKQTISISIIGDKTIEASETFAVNLGTPVNATIAKGTGTGTIVNDDGAAIAGIVSSVKTAAIRSVKISPTPANSVLRVELSGYTGNVSLQLVSIQGRTLLQKKIQAITNFAKEQININGIASGSYLLAVIDDKGNMKTEKVMIAH